MKISDLFFRPHTPPPVKTRFKVLIQKTVSFLPARQKTKWIEVDFADGVFKHRKVEDDYQGWEVSMFWPK